MTIELGAVGAWLPRALMTPALAVAIEDAGFGTLWLGATPPPDLREVGTLLDATERLVIATGISSIWSATPAQFAAAADRIEQRTPGRFLLGLGTQHIESVGPQAARPLDAMRAFLDGLDANGLPKERRVLAALGPRMLALAAERALGAHPYLVPVAATRQARQALGVGPLLAIEQRVVVGGQMGESRAVVRESLERYLALTNYRRNLIRCGFTEQDLAAGGSLRLVDALAAYDIGGGVQGRIAQQRAAGADHVALQVLSRPGQLLADAYRTLGTSLGLAAA